jgi:hypothetical protein
MHMKKAAFAVLSAILSAASLAHAQASPKVYSPQFDNEARVADDVPQVQVWLNDKSFRYGEEIRPYVQTEPGAFLTVVRVSTDGELSILYPQRPDNQTRYRDGQFANDRLPMYGGTSWYVREGTGNGFVFAIASYYRFDFSYYSNKGAWSLARLASANRYGSPFEMVRSFVEEVTNESSSYSMDYVMYDVNANYYRSRYASRYRGYAFSDYLDLCYSSFSYNYYNYCGGYGYRYGYPVIVLNNPNPRNPAAPSGKQMRIKPLVPDPSVPHGPPELPTTQGRLPVSNPSEDAALARRERMLRDARPRSEPQPMPMMKPEPRNEPRMEPRMTPRSEPRIEMRRADPPPPQPRVEVRQASPPPPPPPRERPQKDNN